MYTDNKVIFSNTISKYINSKYNTKNNIFRCQNDINRYTLNPKFSSPSLTIKTMLDDYSWGIECYP